MSAAGEDASVSDARDRLARLSPDKRALLLRRLEAGRRSGDAGGGLPPLAPRPGERHEPFPLTPLQEAYWVGRESSMGSGRTATHSYMEIERGEIDPGRLEEAWNALVARHDMLRARFRADGRQEVLADVPRYEMRRHRLEDASSETIETELLAVRERLSHQVADVARWPLFTIEVALLPEGRARLFVSVDALIVDAWSVRLLFEEWAALYRDPAAELPRLEATFRDYVLGLEAVEETEAFERARAYWRARAPALPSAPALPLTGAAASGSAPRFVRRTRRLEPGRWRPFQQTARGHGLTPTAALLGAYADVLALWAERPAFTLSVPQFNRLPLHADVNRIVGEFASFDLLEIVIRPEERAFERARRHQERLWDDLDHALYGGVRVLRDRSRARGGTGASLMPAVFTSAPQGAEGGAVGPALPDVLGDVVYVNNQSSQVWLDNHVSEEEGALVCDWDTVDAVFPPDVPADMLEAFMRRLERLAAEPAAWEETWAETARSLIPPAHLRVHDEANATEAPIPDGRMEEPVFRYAALHPDDLAVVAGADRLTYGELAERAEGLAERLRDAGVGSGIPVGIVMEKGWEQAVAALATLAAGAAYVPISPDDPPARRARLLERAGCRFALVQEWMEAQDGWPRGLERIAVHRARGAGERMPDRRGASAVSARESGGAEGAERPSPAKGGPLPADIGLVIYTSGSTGEPKAVRIAHRGVVNALAATRREFGIGAGDRVLGLTALHHDMSLFDLFGVLGAGGTLVLPEPSGRRDPAHWAELMGAEGVTIWNSVPAMLEMFLAWAGDDGPVPLRTLRLAFLGGDWIPVTLPDRLRARAPGAEVVSVGGPTETTLWNIWYRVGEVDESWAAIPYGRPIANTGYHILDEAGEERPLWVPGRLWVSGVGVTPGYLDDEASTRARKGEHPRTGEPMWDTGDLGRRLPDGVIEFLGRDDLQVQVAGQRVELGEIEAQMARHPAVRAAVVAPVETEPGRTRLVAYVVWGDAGADDEGLDAQLAAELPPHMIPTVRVPLAELPLTPNGKVDRKSLPIPDAEPAAIAPSPASGETQAGARVRRLVESVLGHAVDPSVNLLEYGANSLDMVRIGNRLEEEFGRRPPIDEIFRLQTVGALAGHYEAGGADDRERAGGSGPPESVRARLAAYRVALSPEEREAFKARRAGLRHDLADRRAIDLPSAGGRQALARDFWERRSHRRYALAAIPLEAFGGFLSGLSELELHGSPKRGHASPGGLYPTQAYIHVKPGRVKGLEAGTYYYDPVGHRLLSLEPGAEIPRDIHVPFVNAPVYDEAAFSIFLVVQLDAIGPLYGERSLHFATLEAGVMSHALELSAPRHGLGVCQMGDVEFERIRRFFHLDDGHVFLHSLVGGASSGEGPESRELVATDEDAADRLLEQVRGLSPEEVERMLRAPEEREGGDE